MFMCIFAAGALIGLEAIRFLNTAPNPLSKDKVVFEIPRGLSPRAVADLLRQQGVITEARHFYYYLRLKKAQPKAGEYEMDSCPLVLHKTQAALLKQVADRHVGQAFQGGECFLRNQNALINWTNR